MGRLLLAASSLKLK